MNFLPGEIDGDTLKLPIGDVPLSESLRGRLQAGPGGGRKGVIVGLRPEDFEDAELVGGPVRGITFKTKIDVLESMGSEYYAYFTVESEKVSSRELDELAHDAGAADLPQQEGNQVVARLDAASQVRQGERPSCGSTPSTCTCSIPRPARACSAAGRTSRPRGRDQPRSRLGLGPEPGRDPAAERLVAGPPSG